MNNLMVWVRSHRWESVSIVLSAALLVVVVLLVMEGSGTTDDEGSAAEGSSEEGSTTSMASGSDNTEAAGGTVSSLTDEDLPALEGPGPFGGDSPIPVTAVIVDNVAGTGIQIGIDQAPLLIEVPVEGGLTRYTALYGEETPALVGPVRSLRPVSADLLALFAPTVFTSGGQPFVTGAVEGAGAILVTQDTSVAFQTLERPRPHHLFVTPSVEGVLTEPVVAPWEYGEWAGGEPATEVSIPFGGGITWRFEDGVYARYEAGERVEVLPEFEGEPVPLTRDTLIILVANQKSAGYTDSTGAEVPTFDVIGAGDVYVFQRGEVVDGRWSRSSQGDGYVFITTEGRPLTIPGGSTYLAVVPRSLEIELRG